MQNPMFHSTGITQHSLDLLDVKVRRLGGSRHFLSFADGRLRLTERLLQVLRQSGCLVLSPKMQEHHAWRFADEMIMKGGDLDAARFEYLDDRRHFLFG